MSYSTEGDVVPSGKKKRPAKMASTNSATAGKKVKPIRRK